jgi:DNA polymerase I-like protein with 3'-5' exonuclease and polymerase domains
VALVNADIKGLEVVVAAQLSGDKILCQEIIDKVDIHDANRVAFNLGEGKSGRLIAKVFKFRLVYGGSAYSYASDPDFRQVSTRQDFWQDVIDKYYKKYKGIYEWHKNLLVEAQTHGQITIPSGRYYPIVSDITKRESWPLTIIKNYPVQGFGADLVMLARLRCNQLLQQSGAKALLVGTIHDSIVIDCPSSEVQLVGQILKEAIESVPKYVKEIWEYDFKLPLTCEISFGPNKYDQKELLFN